MKKLSRAEVAAKWLESCSEKDARFRIADVEQMLRELDACPKPASYTTLSNIEVARRVYHKAAKPRRKGKR